MDKTAKNCSSGDFVVTEDHSLLIKPIMMKSSTVHNVVSFVRDGTPEVRDLLINECEMIFECKVCRSLHRSLANFIAHKRVYCKEHCCESMTLFEQTEIENGTVIVNPESPDDALANEEEKLDGELSDVDGALIGNGTEVGVSVPKIFRLDDGFRASLPSTSNETFNECDDTLSKKPSTDEHLYDDVVRHLTDRNEHRSETTVNMSKIEGSNIAVYQSVTFSNKAQEVINETPQEPTTQEFKVEMPQLQVAPHVVHRPVSKPSQGGALINSKVISVPCIKCRTLFTSIKTLTRHLKSVHGKNRIYFNCLFCSSKFSESWSVVRHILSVHKKSKAQVDKLRMKICQKAFQNILEDQDSSDDESDAAKQSEDGAVSVPQSLLPSILLRKDIAHIICKRCEKVFANEESLVCHEMSCSDEPNVKCEFNLMKPSDVSNGRPKRNVKKKEVADFVLSTHLNPSRESTTLKAKRDTSIPYIKVLDIIDANSLECTRCRQRFSSMSNARRHAAMHMGWNRFKCKHCDYQSYNRSSCCYHIKRVHATRRLLQGQVDKHIEPLSPSSGSSEKSTKLVFFKRPHVSVSNYDSSKAEQSPLSEGKKSHPANEGSDAEQPEDVSTVNTGRSESSPPTLVGKATPSSTSFNISTRRHPRFFDTSPYRRVDQPSTLVTRSGSYIKAKPDTEGRKKTPPSRRKANMKRPEKHVSQANDATGGDTTSTLTDDGALSDTT